MGVSIPWIQFLLAHRLWSLSQTTYYSLLELRVSNPAWGQARAFETNQFSIHFSCQILYSLWDLWILAWYTYVRLLIEAQIHNLSSFSFALCIHKLWWVSCIHCLLWPYLILSLQLLGKHKLPIEHIILQQRILPKTAVHMIQCIYIPFYITGTAKCICFLCHYYMIFHFTLSVLPMEPLISREMRMPYHQKPLHVL